MHTFTELTVPENKVGIHWFGQSSIALKHPDGTVVQIDPYFPHERPADRFIHAEPPLDESTLKTDYVLLTHDHSDHTCIESLERIHTAFPDCRFVGPPESVANMKDAGLPDNLLTEVTAGQITALGSMTAHVVWAKTPGGAPDDDIQPPDVQHLGYVIEVGPQRVYISGDPINTFSKYEELIRPIAALRPAIGLLTNHPTEGEFPFFDGCVDMTLKLGLESVVPTHYQCFVKRNYDPEEWAATFPEEGPRTLVIPYNEAVVYPSS
ncbi:MAG: MBL fold metallo-hydrolase [bacterium]|nr:MBL fold metallo-hydrolase [bacterium]